MRAPRMSSEPTLDSTKVELLLLRQAQFLDTEHLRPAMALQLRDTALRHLHTDSLLRLMGSSQRMASLPPKIPTRSASSLDR